MALARIYGRVIGHGSLAVVTEGFRSALAGQDALAGVYGVDADIGDEIEDTSGSNAPHGIYVGPLHAVGRMFEKGRHQHHWIMVTPNSDQLPRDLVKQLKAYRENHSVHFIAPSRWASNIVANFLGSCQTVPHGVSPEYRVNDEYAREVAKLYEALEFRVLHFSTSARQRKGTVELLKAWLTFQGGGRGWTTQLLCVMDYEAKAALEEAIADGEIQNWKTLSESVRLIDRAELPPEHMARNLSRAHVVCQPSRGEGFGLIPLQALCCGVPIVATQVTGHSEYLRADSPGEVYVTTGEMAPIDDLPGSQAPSLEPGAISDALIVAHWKWRQLHAEALAGAPLWRSNWSWKASLEPFIEQLRASR